ARQERLLNRGGDLELLLVLRTLERLPIQTGVLDRDRRFGAERLERGARRRGAQGASLTAVEIEHADHLFIACFVGPLAVSHVPERRTEHAADAERDGAHVRLRHALVQQVVDDGVVTGFENSLWNLPARRERSSRQRDAADTSRELEFELGRHLVREHDETAL